ncbi:hypothetical protein R1sor_027383 [Riccia sorocarpa]|uniref:MULE transposase domain-containing protein n=1 Tax=Riccia sorocarpa TaxID=122646 RepID=A0ABD3GH71_9MARC
MCNFCHIRIERRAVQAMPEEGERKKQKIDRYDYRGVVNVKVCIAKKEMELTLTHLCPHPKPEYMGEAVPEAALRRIEEIAGTNIRRDDVYRMLCLEGLIDLDRIRRAQVNFWMAEKLAKLVSQPTAGSREPKSGKDRVLKKMLKLWFLTLRERGLKPIFAVTNKDVGQIGGTNETFPNTYVQMCLWHGQRAVELRIQLLDSPIRPYDAAVAHVVHNFIDETWTPDSLLQRGHICPVDNKKSVLCMFSMHYDMSPLREVVDAELDPWRNFTTSTPLVHDWTGDEFQAVDNVVHDWIGEEFQAIDDLPYTADVKYDYLQVFKEKWLKLVQNTEYLIEKEHDNHKFIEAVDKALYSFYKAIGQCMTALRSGRQQQTWAKTGLSMWLR